MRQLSGIDADMLAAETAEWHMHLGALVVLDPATAPQGFDRDTLCAALEARAVEVPELRERLHEVPFGLDAPYWVADPDVLIADHVHSLRVDPPGGDPDVAAAVGEIAARKLDRHRPLWEMWLLEGLADGKVAMLTKIHHAAVDGVGGALLLGRLFDDGPLQPSPQARSAPTPDRAPHSIELAARTAGSFVALPWRLATAAAHTISSVRALRARGPDLANATGPFHCPDTPFNRPVSAKRSFTSLSLPLADFRRARRVFGSTFNDVVLAVVGGGLRRYLDGIGSLPALPLVAAVPVSVRGEQDLASGGNLVSGMFVALATDVDHPVERLRRVARTEADAKQLYATGIENAVMEWAALPAPALVAVAARLYAWSHLADRISGPQIFNVLVSNVMGPEQRMYLAGARVESVFPFGPVLDSIGLNITVLSYGDEVGFGILSCPDLLPDPDRVTDAIRVSLEELVAHTEPPD